MSGSATSSPLADDYEQLPYASMPYASTQPTRLAALGALHGLDSPPPERARVLELGCAGAGNIIPLAARFPQARFFGVDLARRHIDDAQHRIGALGLNNIEARQGDINELEFGEDAFDYIICHGVFSWAPPGVQDAILRICTQSLSRDGLAVVSYNVFPGWRLRSAIRDICLRHAGEAGAPMERVAKVRAVLNDIAAFSHAANPYRLLLRNEARRIAHRPASYILGEFLAAHNAPCHFVEFAARARAHHLRYICEADLEAAVPETIDAAARGRLQAHAGAGPIGFEQSVDDFTGRTFRSSVLTKGSQAPPRRDYAKLKQLHLAADFRPDPKAGDGAAFKDGRGRALGGGDATLDRALARLAEAAPNTAMFAELAPGENSGADDERRVLDALAAMACRGQITLSATAIRVGRASAALPLVWPLARAEAASGQPWMTSLTHTPVATSPAVAAMVALLDGSRTRAELIAAFADKLARGEVNAPELKAGAAPDTISQVAADSVARVLSYLEREALLLPETR